MKKYIRPGMEITYFVTEGIMEGENNIFNISGLQPATDVTNMGTEKQQLAGFKDAAKAVSFFFENVNKLTIAQKTR